MQQSRTTSRTVIRWSTPSSWRSFHSDARAAARLNQLRGQLHICQESAFHLVQPGLHGPEFSCQASLTCDLAVLLLLLFLLRLRLLLLWFPILRSCFVHAVRCDRFWCCCMYRCRSIALCSPLFFNIFRVLQHFCFFADLVFQQGFGLQQIFSAPARRFVVEKRFWTSSVRSASGNYLAALVAAAAALRRVPLLCVNLVRHRYGCTTFFATIPCAFLAHHFHSFIIDMLPPLHFHPLCTCDTAHLRPSVTLCSFSLLAPRQSSSLLNYKSPGVPCGLLVLFRLGHALHVRLYVHLLAPLCSHCPTCCAPWRLLVLLLLFLLALLPLLLLLFLVKILLLSFS